MQELSVTNGEESRLIACVLVRRDSEFGLLRDVEKQTQILGRSLEECWGPAQMALTFSGILSTDGQRPGRARLGW
jgi:hypothetical protein